MSALPSPSRSGNRMVPQSDCDAVHALPSRYDRVHSAGAPNAPPVDNAQTMPLLLRPHTSSRPSPLTSVYAIVFQYAGWLPHPVVLLKPAVHSAAGPKPPPVDTAQKMPSAPRPHTSARWSP